MRMNSPQSNSNGYVHNKCGIYKHDGVIGQTTTVLMSSFSNITIVIQGTKTFAQS